MDECADNLESPCHVDAYCDNTIGSYNCTCYDGYSGNGFDNCTGEWQKSSAKVLIALKTNGKIHHPFLRKVKKY